MSEGSSPVTSVMVGDDGSSGASAALGWARRLADAVGAHLTVVRARAEEHPFGPVNPERDGTEGILELTGPPVPALLGACRTLQVDLVVVGRRGAGGFSELRLGGTAHQLAEHSPSPLAVIPQGGAPGGQHWPYSGIVVGLDGSAGADAALSWAASMAALAGSEVTVVHAVDFAPLAAVAGVPQELYDASVERRRAELDRWCGPLRDVGVAYNTIVAEGGAAGIILDAVDRVGAQLAVVGRHGQGELPHLPMGSVAHRVIAFSPCPAVVIPGIRAADATQQV